MITSKQIQDWKRVIIEQGFPAWEEKVFEWLRKDRVIKDAMRRHFHEKQSGKCMYCEEPVGLKNMHIEHLIPPKRGGSETLENKGGACGHCNSSKGNMTFDEFMVKIGKSHVEETKVVRKLEENPFRESTCHWACYEVLNGVDEFKDSQWVVNEITSRGIFEFNSNHQSATANRSMDRFPDTFEDKRVGGKRLFKIRLGKKSEEKNTHSSLPSDVMDRRRASNALPTNKNNNKLDNKKDIDMQTSKNKIAYIEELTSENVLLRKDLRIAELELDSAKAEATKKKIAANDRLIHLTKINELPTKVEEKKTTKSNVSSNGVNSKLALFVKLLRKNPSEMTTLESMSFPEMQEYVKSNSERFHKVKADKGEEEAWKDIAHSMENEIVHEVCDRPIAKKFSWRRNHDSGFCAFVFSLKAA